MKNSLMKKLGGALLTVFILALAATSANAVAVSISCKSTNSPANPVPDHTLSVSSPMPVGKFVQIIQSTDASIGVPDKTSGAPTGDSLIANTKAIGPTDGEFVTSAAITSGNYVALRVWETWTGTGAPTGEYVTSKAAAVGTGFAFVYKPVTTEFTLGKIIIADPLSITTASLADGTVNAAGYSQTLAATGGTAPYTWSISAGSLPPGLNIANGVISGKPTAEGLFNFTVKATDAANVAATKALSIKINPAEDTTPPTVINTFPSAETPAASRSRSTINFDVYFNEIMDDASVKNISNYSISGEKSPREITSIYLSGTKKTVTLTLKNNNGQPVLPFDYGETVTCVVKKTVKDKAGNEMEKDYTWTFKVNAPAPTLTSALQKNSTTLNWVYVNGSSPTGNLVVTGSNLVEGSQTDTAANPPNHKIQIKPSTGSAYLDIPSSNPDKIYYWAVDGKQVEIGIPDIIGATNIAAGSYKARVVSPSHPEGSNEFDFTIKPQFNDIGLANTLGSKTPITIGGTGFGGTMSVAFTGQNPANSKTLTPVFTSNSTITVDTSSLAIDTYTVKLTVNGQESPITKTFAINDLPAPSISGITWNTADGDLSTPINENLLNQNNVYGTIIIKGNNFGDAPGANGFVSVGGVKVPNSGSGIKVYSWKAGEISCGIPLSDTTGKYVLAGPAVAVHVTSNAKITDTSAKTIVINPKVYDVSPDKGTAGANTLAVKGTAFDTTAGNNTIKIGSLTGNITKADPQSDGILLTVAITIPPSTTGALPVSVQVNSQNSNSLYDYDRNNNGQIDDPVIFTVINATLSSIALTPVNPSIVNGNTQQFTATGTYSDGSTANITSQVAWTSSDTSVAAISASGLAVGLKAGATNITASFSGKTSLAQKLTVTEAPDNKPVISGLSQSSASIGQTLVISGSNFLPYANGISKVSFTGNVENTGTPVNPVEWSENRIVVAIPSGILPGNNWIIVSNENGAFVKDFIVDAGKIYLDDFEGGAAGSFDPNSPAPKSGYYVFDKYDAQYNPDKKSTSYPDMVLKAGDGLAGSAAMELKYSSGNRAADANYAGKDKDWGGGWGAILANPLNLSAAKKIGFNLKWDGSQNDINLQVKDEKGVIYTANIPNSKLNSNSYIELILNISDFARDSSGTEGAIDWSKITGYQFIYKGKAVSTSTHYIDALTAYTADEPPPPDNGENPVISSISPASAPTGAKVTVSGLRFGGEQGQSRLVFNNKTTSASFNADILSWKDTVIEARVPKSIVPGDYEIKVLRMTIAAGSLKALESGILPFQVTAAGAASVYPNPFNAGTDTLTIVVTNANGTTNIGYYIFDLTGRQVHKTVTSASQISWTGFDQNGLLVGDGAYILRVVNEDTKSLIAKGKILVIKK